MLKNISRYSWPADYVREREAITTGMAVDKVKAIADIYMQPNSMVQVVVGDRATQFGRLAELGLSEPTLLDGEHLTQRAAFLVSE